MPTLMKGHTFKKHGHKMTYPCYVEAKEDEVRCHLKITREILSYEGKRLYNLEMAAQNVFALMHDYGLSELDTGVLVNGNYADTIRYVRSHAVPEDLRGARVEFIVFDAPNWGGEPYYDRDDKLSAMVQYGQAVGAPVRRPHYVIAESPEEVHEAYAKYREQGFEGAMVKSTNHTYERGKRIYGWLKYKPEEDADGVVTALHEAHAQEDQPARGIRKGDPLGRIGSATLRVGAGDAVSYATPHGIPHELGRDMYLHPEKYIGREVEFKYMERDRQGGYRHPTWHRFREDRE